MGMGIELVNFVITTKTNKVFFDKNKEKFVTIVNEDCLFLDEKEAKNKLKNLDFGYIVKSVRVYRDIDVTKINVIN